jgi:hypothetical protein
MGGLNSVKQTNIRSTSILMTETDKLTDCRRYAVWVPTQNLPDMNMMFLLKTIFPITAVGWLHRERCEDLFSKASAKHSSNACILIQPM